MIFGVENILSIHIDNCKISFLVLDEQSTDDITDSIGTTEKNLVLALLRQIQNFL